MKSNKLLIFLSIIIFLVPFVFWMDSIQIGGDDSKLYYYFPAEYVINSSVKIISDNQAASLGNYFSQTYTLPLLVVLRFASSILKNGLVLQTLAYSINLLLSFLFLYKLSGMLLPKTESNIKILGAVFYTFSIFTYYTVWNHQLLSVYLVSFFPIVLYYVGRFVQKNEASDFFKLAITIIVYSFTFFSIPWIFATVLVLIPYFVYFFFESKKRFLSIAILMPMVAILINAHWLFHFLYAPFSSVTHQTDVISGVTSESVAQSNIINIVGTSGNNTLFYPMTQLFHKSIQKDYGWRAYGLFKVFYEKNSIVNIGLLLICITSFFYVREITEKKLLAVAFCSWLLALYLFTVRIGNWGLPLFLQLNSHIPGFTMFRNMYDKFGLGLAISSALLLVISTAILYKRIQITNYKQLLLICIAIVVALNAYPFVVGKMYELSYGNTTAIYNRLQQTDMQITSVINGFSGIDTESRVLWLPLNTANYVIVKDKLQSNAMYAGASPLSLLSPYQDFAGLLSFNSFQQTQFLKLLDLKDYPAIGRLFQTLNVNYIAQYDFQDDQIQNSYLFTKATPGDFFSTQKNPEFVSEIVGQKIREVEGYYSLHKIQPSYQSQKIYLTNDYENIATESTKLTYEKIDSHMYKIEVKNIEQGDKLVFLDPYHDKWEIYASNDLATPLISGKHDIVFEYANGWEVDSTLVAGTQYILFFKAFRYQTALFSVSIGTGLIIVASYVAIAVKRRKL